MKLKLRCADSVIQMRIYETTVSCKVVGQIDFDKVDSPARTVAYLESAYAEFPLKESFYVIFLDRRNHAIGRQLITLGMLTSTLVHPREIFRAALLNSAAAIIVSHNHPSGDPSPSAAAIQLTRQLREASAAVDIALLDHVIAGKVGGDPIGKGYYSFREAGLL